MPEAKVSVPAQGSHAKVEVRETVVQEGPHTVNVDANVLVPMVPSAPGGGGVGATYRHDAGHMARVQVDHMQAAGTTVTAAANARVWTSDDKTAHVDVSGSHARHFSAHGPPRNNSAAMFSFTKRF